MTLQVNMRPNASANGGPGIGLMTAAGNPWTIPDALAQDLVNRGVADAYNWPAATAPSTVGSLGPVDVSGTPGVGNVLTATLAAGWSVTGYQWVRTTNGTPADIAGATSSTYVQTTSDRGAGISVGVRVTGLSYNGGAVVVPPATTYLGAVGTATRMPNVVAAAASITQMISRTRHIMRSAFTQIQFRYPNGALVANNGGITAGTGGPARITACVVVGGANASGAIVGGTLYQCTWGGVPYVDVPDKTHSPLPDPIIASGGRNSVVWMQVGYVGANGAVYCSGATGSEELDAAHGEQFRFAASGLDMSQVNSMGVWNGGATSSNHSYRPSCILALTVEPTFFLSGDSIGAGFHESANNAANGDKGLTARLVGQYFGYVNVCQGGTRAAHFTTPGQAAFQLELAQYCSHHITMYGTNDLSNSPFPSGATLVARLQAVLALTPTLPGYACTVSPRTNDAATTAATAADGSDQTVFNSNTYNARRSSANSTLRAGGIAGITGVIDLAAAASLGGVGDDTKWYANGSANYMFQTYTPADFLHPGTQGATRVASDAALQSQVSALAR